MKNKKLKKKLKYLINSVDVLKHKIGDLELEQIPEILNDIKKLENYELERKEQQYIADWEKRPKPRMSP